MCRRCGEPDRRPGAARRRQLTARLLELHGNGVIAPCAWQLVGCEVLVAAQPGVLVVGGQVIRLGKLERDRIIPGGSYGLYNLLPACGPCNRQRSWMDGNMPDGCDYGTGDVAV